ncbi:MAG TPA: hypothetical protein VGL83_07955 [Stellaceae bacterium]
MAIGTILKRIGAGVMLMAFASSLAHADANDDRIAALQAKYRCPIFNYLNAIHAVPTYARTDNRYLIITIEHRGDERYYAQCAFDNLDTRMICELDSPFFNPVIKKYFRGDRLKLVKSLGYRLHRKNNYYQWRKSLTPEDRYAIAGLLVDTVGRVFDMQADETLMYEAPLVTGTPQPTEYAAKYCAPQISLR